MGPEEYKVILDLPAKTPALAFGQQADAFKGIIEQSKPQFVIGIFGGWGSGKTTLMQAVETRLDKNLTIPVWFSAWRYEKEEHLIVPLLDEVRESLIAWAEQHPESKEVVRKTAATIGKVALSLLAGFSANMGIPGVMGLSFTASQSLAEAQKLSEEKLNDQLSQESQSLYHASFRALKAALSEFLAANPNRRIVVFVDDLDRCLPEGALQVLESMKLFFDLPGFIFVAGLDQSVVEWLIDVKYGTESTVSSEDQLSGYRVRGMDYIKKIFQVPYTLAPVAVNQLGDFLLALYAEADLPPGQRDDLQNVVQSHLRYVVTGAQLNPREIKRYINSYILTLKVKPYLQRDTILALQTIAFRSDWQSVQDAIITYRQAFVNALVQELDGQQGALENLSSHLANLPQTFLQYVAEGEPGHALLQTRPIDEYIYAGEATRSSQDPKLLDTLHDVGLAKQTLREANQQAPLDISVARDAANTVEHRLDKVASELASYARTPIAPMIIRDIRTLRQRLDYVPEDSSTLRDWYAAQQQLLDKIQGDLLTLYQYSSLAR